MPADIFVYARLLSYGAYQFASLSVSRGALSVTYPILAVNKVGLPNGYCCDSAAICIS